MKILERVDLRGLVTITIAMLTLPVFGVAQTDEIQVYDAAIVEPNVFNLTVHDNFTPEGMHTPSFFGGLIPDKSFNGVPEWAYGVTTWFEVGLYLPLYSFSTDRGATVNGGKVRLLLVKPHAADHKFFYGINFEFSYNVKHWDLRHYTSEIRPIIGLHLHPVDIIVNPILDNSFTGGFMGLDFAPATRVAYNLSPKWSVAAEEYADFGPLRDIYCSSQQSQQIFAVVDRTSKFLNIEAGIGFGMTSATNKVTLKLILSRDLNAANERRKP